MTSIVTVSGSPRRRGNSTILAENVISGAKSLGSQNDTYFLHGMDIKPCNACDLCHEDLNSDCVLKDDMQKIYPKLRQANAIIIASPIYWFTFSAQTKIFIDRCYALGVSGDYVLKGKLIGIVLTYEDSDPLASGAVNAIRTFQDIFAYVGAPIIGMVYGRASGRGEIANNRELMDKAFKLGKQLVKGKPN